MTEMTRIEINPNLRVERFYTMAHLDEDVYGVRPRRLDAVQVFESASGLIGRGWVTDIDEVERTITVMVDWANLVLTDPNRAASSPSSVLTLTPPEPDVGAPSGTLTGS